MGEALVRAPTLLAAADLLERGVVVVIAGSPDLAVTQALLATALASPDPAAVVLRSGNTTALPPLHPAYGKKVPPGTVVGFLCRPGLCSSPISDPATLRRALVGRVGSPPEPQGLESNFT
jgi:uncharacterized protein YyaL (SSP411 family)